MVANVMHWQLHVFTLPQSVVFMWTPHMDVEFTFLYSYASSFSASRTICHFRREQVSPLCTLDRYCYYRKWSGSRTLWLWSNFAIAHYKGEHYWPIDIIITALTLPVSPKRIICTNKRTSLTIDISLWWVWTSGFQSIQNIVVLCKQLKQHL